LSPNHWNTVLPLDSVMVPFYHLVKIPHCHPFQGEYNYYHSLEYSFTIRPGHFTEYLFTIWVNTLLLSIPRRPLLPPILWNTFLPLNPAIPWNTLLPSIPISIHSMECGIPPHCHYTHPLSPHFTCSLLSPHLYSTLSMPCLTSYIKKFAD
jgi:hypothetical protein